MTSKLAILPALILVAAACTCSELGNVLVTPDYPPSDTNMLAPTQNATLGSSTSGGAPGSIDACTVLTAQDAEAFIGSPVAVEEHVRTEMAGTCYYRSAIGGSTSINIVIQYSADSSVIRAMFDALKQRAGNDIRPVSGVGDDAFFQTLNQQLYFVQGGYFVFIGGVPGPGVDLLSGLTAAAKSAAARLP